MHTPDGEPCGLLNHMTSNCRKFTYLLFFFFKIFFYNEIIYFLDSTSFIFMTNMVPSCPYMTNYDYYMILRVNNVGSDMNMLYIILLN